MKRPAVNKEKAIETPSLLQFDKLIGYLKYSFTILPDTRVGFNTTYTIKDAALSAFSVFFMQCPSFLAYQRQMQATKGQSNASSIFQIENIPSDNQTRNLLDPVSPNLLNHVYAHIYQQLLTQGLLTQYRCLNNTILIAVDGVCYHSSASISCDKCNHKRHKNGKVTYTHSAITPVIVAPGNEHVIPLVPEFLTPQDGHDKQDGEQAAIKRWLKAHATTYRELGITFLGDDLYARQPICEAVLAENCHFLFTCKEDSHKTLYDWVGEIDNSNTVETHTVHWRHGKKRYVDTYRFINRVPLRDSHDALHVNWCELVTTDAQGELVYKNAFVTDHALTPDNVAHVVKAGRARWKIENENNNTLKTKGYNLAHNFGHGSLFLSQLLLSMNLLAFLYHTVLNLVDKPYQCIRAKLPTRKTFFEHVRTLTHYIYFQNWQTMMQFMMTGLEIKLPNST